MFARRAFCSGTLALLLVISPALLLSDDAVVLSSSQSQAAVNPPDPLIRLLLSKGIITADEARFVGAGTSSAQHDKLLLLLKEKGLLSRSELDELRSAPPSVVNYNVVSGGNPDLRPAVLTTVSTPQTATQAAPAKEAKPPAPTFVPAVAPLRVLQLEPVKKDGLIPDIKLGSGARLKLYGFVKASAIYDSSSPYGNDFPLPGFIGSVDQGPNPGSEFHVKARFARMGTNFEWPDASKRLSITGKFEYDFEGNFTRVNNRNISSIRSSQASLRLAWGRLDYKASEHTSFFALFGQDWTPFASSTLPNIVETTGLGIGFGTLYERSPQMRFGVNWNMGGSRKFMISPEFAMVLPTSGNPPVLLDNQLGYGERQGPDSSRPNIQGRLVTQWQLDRAPGVAPAQFIVSLMNGSREVRVPVANIVAPAGSTPAVVSQFAALKAANPRGFVVGSDQWGGTVEIQLPTRFVTLIGKYYNGSDLRYYFAGGLFSTFNNTAGLTAINTVTTLDGSTVAFGTNAAGQVVVAEQLPVRVQGGFVNVGFPLGRIFHADPAGRNAGWQLYFHYGIDDPYARDARRTAAIAADSGGNRDKSDLGAATLYWKINPFLTFGLEQSLYRTRLTGGGAVWNTPAYRTPLWGGTPAREWHDARTEFSTTFTF